MGRRQYSWGIKLNAGGTSNYPGGLVFATKSPGGNTNDLTDKMVIDANGNVGIGTASPSTELEVAGTITIGNGSQLNAIRTDSDGNLQFLRNAASNDSPTITINDDTGNVGVGTTSPGYKLDVNGTVNTSGGIRSYKDGVVAEFQPTTSGSYTLINFHSKVNSGSDKGFILVQDESANSPGSSAEDLRMTIGVHNDFRQSASHSDELWFQGGGRLVYNVGSWDSELDTIIGTAGTGTTGGHEWRVNDSTKMLINHTGNVGIGTTSPGYKLDVNGTVNTGALTATSEVLKLSSGTGTSNAVALSIQNFSSSYTEIENGFGSRIQFRTNRGTSGGSTSQSAEIKGYIYGGAGGSGDYHALDLDAYGDNGSFSRGISIYGKGNGTSILPADVTVHGNLGIGTTSTGYKLDVNGTVNTGALTATTGTFSGYLSVINNQEIRHPTTDSRGYVELRFNNNGPNQGSGAGLLLASDEVASFNPIAIIDTWTSGVSGAPPLVFKTRGTERMRLTDSGNFGIGTTGPTSKLHVYGGSAVIENTGTNIVGLYINNNSTPTTGYSYLLNGPRPGTTTSGAVHFINGSGRTGDGGVNTYTIRNDSGNLRLGNASYSTILEGSVGIGTASPSYNLHVSGTSQFEAEMRWSLGTRTSHAGYSTNKDWYIRSGETAGKVILQDGGGNVGIGTASPGYKLVVAGDIYATGDIIGANGNFGISGVVSCLRTVREVDRCSGLHFSSALNQPVIWPVRYFSGAASTSDNTVLLGYPNLRFGAAYIQNLYRNAEATFSDDRIKTGESLITNATETLLKLKPQTYDKHTFTYDEITDEEYSNVNADGLIYDKTMETWVDRSEYKRNTLATKETHPWIRRTLSKDTRKEAGLIAQDIWYDVPELKYIVNIADDASPAEEKPVSETDDIQQDPDYDAAGWGTTEASVSYTDLISYLIKSIQELNERIKVLENPTN
jgi:hypothetical protein